MRGSDIVPSRLYGTLENCPIPSLDTQIDEGVIVGLGDGGGEWDDDDPWKDKGQ